ncbi:unnamed protein product [Camellia sinensis]
MELAKRALPKMYFDYYNGGAQDQHTLRENMEAFCRITRVDIDWLRSVTSLPILVKGVLTAEDATKIADDLVVRAVGGKIPVLIDGGVRRGTDIFKALALGAQALMIGRPVLYGLAAKGENGVRRVIEMLKDELELTMALSGCPTVKDITRSHALIRKWAPVAIVIGAAVLLFWTAY